MATRIITHVDSNIDDLMASVVCTQFKRTCFEHDDPLETGVLSRIDSHRLELGDDFLQ